MLILVDVVCDGWRARGALISQMAFEFANLSCDHLEVTRNQRCSDGALDIGK